MFRILNPLKSDHLGLFFSGHHICNVIDIYHDIDMMGIPGGRHTP